MAPARPPTSDPFDENRKDLATAPEILAPTVERVGLGYVARFPQLLATMRLTRLHDSSREGLSGELTVEVGPLPPRNAVQHLAQARFNLSSLTTRKQWATELNAKREAGWRDALELFCLSVLQLHREGSPFETLSGSSAATPARMLVKPLIWSGAPTLLFGPGGTGKSTLATAIGLVALTGQPILPGFTVAEPVAVLVLDWEDSRDEWEGQIRAICRGAGLEWPLAFHYRRMAGALSDQIEGVAAFVDEWRVGLVIVDSVEAACGSGNDHETYNARAERLFDALRMQPAASLLLDHVAATELDKEGPSQKSIGGVRKRDRARALYALRTQNATRERIEVVLSDVKRNRRAKQEPLGIALNFGDFDADGRARRISFGEAKLAAEVRGSAIDRIEAYLVEEGERSDAELALALGLPAGTIRSCLQRYPKRIRRLPSGKIGALLQ